MSHTQDLSNFGEEIHGSQSPTVPRAQEGASLPLSEDVCVTASLLMHTSTHPPARASAGQALTVTYKLLFCIFEFLLLVIVSSMEKMQQEQVTEDRGLKSKCS